MSVVAARPETSAARPPIVPPTRTTFDPTPDPYGDPIHKRIAESVERLFVMIAGAADDQLDTYLDLLFQRRSWIESEIATAQMLERPSLPPAISEFLTLEPYMGATEGLVPFYQRLSNRLDEAIRAVRARQWVLKQDVFSSDR